MGFNVWIIDSTQTKKSMCVTNAIQPKETLLLSYYFPQSDNLKPLSLQGFFGIRKRKTKNVKQRKNIYKKKKKIVSLGLHSLITVTTLV